MNRLFSSHYIYGRIIRKAKAKYVRAPPIYPLKLWSVFSRVEYYLPSTNNSVEAWHKRINLLIVINHPSFYVVLRALQVEQHHTEVESYRLHIENKVRQTDRVVLSRQNRIKNLIEGLKSGDRRGLDYIDAIAQNLSMRDERNFIPLKHSHSTDSYYFELSPETLTETSSFLLD